MLKQLLAITFLAALTNPALAQVTTNTYQYAAGSTQPAANASTNAPWANTATTQSPANASSNQPWANTAPVQSGLAAPTSAANYPMNQAMPTSTQGASSPNGPSLQQSQMSTLSQPFGGSLSLPATTLDSFVQNAGGMAFQIYGDEGTDGPPPLSDFDYINDGIQSGGLTTGHASGLPSAWGTPQ